MFEMCVGDEWDHSYDIEDGNCAWLQVDISAQENHVLFVLT